MVRTSDLTAGERRHLRGLVCPTIKTSKYVGPAPPAQRTVALISSAGLMRRDDHNISGHCATYRSFDASIGDDELLINHVSVNFDRSGFAEDVNCVFPRERLRELAAAGDIGQAAHEHYSFMGATDPEAMREHVAALADRLHQQGVDTAVLLPV